MKGSLLGLLMGLYSAVVASADANFSGRWEITTRYPGGQFIAGLNLREVSGSFEGRSHIWSLTGSSTDIVAPVKKASCILRSWRLTIRPSSGN
jgi:hypothetical protein